MTFQSLRRDLWPYNGCKQIKYLLDLVASNRSAAIGGPTTHSSSWQSMRSSFFQSLRRDRGPYNLFNRQGHVLQDFFQSLRRDRGPYNPIKLSSKSGTFSCLQSLRRDRGPYNLTVGIWIFLLIYCIFQSLHRDLWPYNRW